MWKLCSWHLQSRSRGRTLHRRRARAVSSTRGQSQQQTQAHVVHVEHSGGGALSYCVVACRQARNICNGFIYYMEHMNLIAILYGLS